jgi:hypothetical protein
VLLRGPALRQALLELLDTAGTPIDVNELVHVVLAAGWGLTGRPAQTVANALAVERRRGRVRRVARGRYASVHEDGAANSPG